VPTFDSAAFSRRFTHRTATARDIQIHYVEGGSGVPVLLVPGWPQSWYAWRHVMPMLADSYRVIAIDPPGLGESGAPAAYDTATIAGYIGALLDTLKLRQVAYVGHDIGAWIGYAFAVRHSERVRQLVLIDAAIPGIAPADAFALTPERINKTWHFSFNALPDLPETLVAGRERSYFEWLFNSRSFDKSAIDFAALAEYTRVYAAPGAMSRGFAYYRAIFDSIAQNKATAAIGIPMPVLAIGGAHWMGPLMEAMVAPVARDLRVEIVEGSGHFVPEEAPDKVGHLLLEFLQRRVASGAAT
jgi:pimeloyl-ACP methyl ester carboxylesterase